MNKSITTKFVKITETKLDLSRAEIEQAILAQQGLTNGIFSWQLHERRGVTGCFIVTHFYKQPSWITQHSYEYDTEKKILRLNFDNMNMMEKIILAYYQMEGGSLCWHDDFKGLQGCTISHSKSTVLDNQTINQSSL